MDGERRIEIQDSQVGVVGDGARVDEVHFHRQVIVYDGVRPVSAGALLDACRAQVGSVLYDERHKYDADLYVNRAIEEEIDAFLDGPGSGSAPNCFLIVAPAGSGKTNLLCDLARVRASRQPTLLLKGSSVYLSGTTGLLGAVKEELEAASAEVAFRSAGDSLHTLHRLAGEVGRHALIFLDAINEHDRPAAMRRALEDLLRKTRRRRVRLVITCRDYYWGLFKGRFWEGATINGLPAEDEGGEDGDGGDDFSRFTADEHEQALPLYLEHYGISGRPVGDAAEQCRHPLLLRFFCEAYRGQDVGEVEDIRLKELFDRYWAQKLVSIAERMIRQGDERLQDGLTQDVEAYLLNVAAHMLHNNVRAVPLSEIAEATHVEEVYSDPRSIYGRIRDEFIILEEKERGAGRRKTPQIAFVYEEFMEYVMARSLTRDWARDGLDEPGILAAVDDLTEKYDEFAQILGVMVYLALMLKDERDLALWSLLLERGERWQRVVFEAFRKLPEDQLDGGVFDALEQMVRTGDEEIQKQVLDFLKLQRVREAEPKSASLAVLVAELATSDEVPIARRAVLALASMPAEAAVRVLEEALFHPYAAVRDNAVTALTEHGQPVMDLFASILEDDSWSVRAIRRWAADALSRFEPERAEPLLVAALQDGDREVREAAARSLDQLGWEPGDEEAAAWYHMGRGAFDACARLGEAAWDPLNVALNDFDEDVVIGAIEALVHVDDAYFALEALREALEVHELEGRLAAVKVLGQLGDARAADILIPAACEDDGPYVREAAGHALAAMGAEAAPALRGLDDFEWCGLQYALGPVEDGTVDTLIDSLADENPRVREGAARALKWLKVPRAVAPLIAALEDRERHVRREAVAALRRIGTPGALAAVRRSEDD